MRHVRTLWALVVVGTALAVAAPAGGANECDGLMVCVPVAGPWVVVPTSTSAPRQRVEFQLTCPRGHVVGGLDALLSVRAIDVGFIGTLGSPVNPGITTSRSVVFLGTYAGRSARGCDIPPVHRLHPGCGRRLTHTDLGLPGTPWDARDPAREVRPRPAGDDDRDPALHVA